MTLRQRNRNALPILDLNGPEGNAFGLLGLANRCMRELDYDDVRCQEIKAEMKSGDYRNLVEVFEREFGEYFDIILPDSWDY